MWKSVRLKIIKDIWKWTKTFSFTVSIPLSYPRVPFGIPKGRGAKCVKMCVLRGSTNCHTFYNGENVIIWLVDLNISNLGYRHMVKEGIKDYKFLCPFYSLALCLFLHPLPLFISFRKHFAYMGGTINGILGWDKFLSSHLFCNFKCNHK